MSKKTILILVLPLFLLVYNSCKETTPNDTTKIETSVDNGTNDEIINSTATDSLGRTITMIFNNSQDNVTVIFEGDTVLLTSQKPASGIWYKNENFELRGKGKETVFSKDGNVIFKNNLNLL
ncbi:MAG: MliC family protein [Saprospiraceae bacterium]